ncbi:MAG: hypothetical protein H7Y31_00400 [Chitinophagaceae bacterium]|nr:hypothetical protein [Chitinophagaceae bacterium]
MSTAIANGKLRQCLERFGKLPDNDWELVLPFIKAREFKKHELFCEEGKRSFEVAFVVSGTFRQFYSKEGELAFAQPNVASRTIRLNITCIGCSIGVVFSPGIASTANFKKSCLASAFSKTTGIER